MRGALALLWIAGCSAARPPFTGAADQHWTLLETTDFEVPPTDVIIAFVRRARERGCNVQRIEEPVRTWSKWGTVARGGGNDQWQGALAYCEGFDLAAQIVGDKVAIGCGRPLPDDVCRATFYSMIEE